jgi:hypothetical protein
MVYFVSFVKILEKYRSKEFIMNTLLMYLFLLCFYKKIWIFCDTHVISVGGLVSDCLKV